MVALTLTPTDLTSSFITDLKSAGAAAITAVVGTDIREANWMGKGFTYPCIRLEYNQFQRRVDSSNCRWYTINLSIYTFTEGSSSKSCQDLMGLIGIRYEEKVLDATLFKSQPLNIQYMPPVPFPNGEISAWRGEVVVYGVIKRKP